jgi:hypothetical protein
LCLEVIHRLDVVGVLGLGVVSLLDVPLLVVSLEFKLSHIQLTGSVELRSDHFSGLVLFDQNCRMDRLKLLVRQDRKWKVKFMVNKITRMINHSTTNCLTRSNVQIL